MKIIALAAAVLFIVYQPAAEAKGPYRQCGSALVTFAGGGEGSAYKIHATNVTCRRARIVARACITNRLTGWQPTSLPGDDRGTVDRIDLRRGRAIITFALVGGGFNCAD
jgi:hypothetical protein